MQSDFFPALEALRPGVRANWENLLRIERINSALANPDTLVHLLDTTLDEIFRDLRAWSPRRHPPSSADPLCPCGRNPLLAYFTSGHQAMREALVVVQAATPDMTEQQRDAALACLDQVFSHIARREVESFCSICQYRSAVQVGQPAKSPSLHS